MESKKKREVTVGGDGEVEDEIKMEKFYSLLRSFRDARDRRRRELKELESIESNKKKMKITTSTTTKPKSETCFEWQDFTTEIHFRKPPLVYPNPVPCDTIKGKNKNEQQQQQQQDSLDLKLAL